MGKTERDASIIFIDNIDFLNSDWKFVNISVYVKDSNTSMLSLEMSSSDAEFAPLNVFISNCTFGDWLFTNISTLSIKNCSIRNSHFEHDKTVLRILNSSAKLEKLAIEKFKGSSVIEVLSKSNVSIKLSDFSANIVVEGIVRVIDQSSPMMEDCHFYDNNGLATGTIYSMGSLIHIYSSNFENNSAPKGGAAFVGNQTITAIINSSFIENKALYGGAIYGEDNIHLNVVDSGFVSNIAGDLNLLPKEILIGNIEYEGGAISCWCNCTIRCENSVFSGNQAIKSAHFSVETKAFGGGNIDLSSLYPASFKFIIC